MLWSRYLQSRKLNRNRNFSNLGTGTVKNVTVPQHKKIILLNLQEEEADTEDDDEYVPPTLIMDTELDYGEIEPEVQ